jgi:hypothetical protein
MFVLNSAKDGYTMMLSATGQATQNPPPSDKQATLTGGTSPRWSHAPASARGVRGEGRFAVNSLREVVNDVKKDPAKYRYGTSGPGGVGSIAMSVLFGSTCRRPKARPRHAPGRRTDARQCRDPARPTSPRNTWPSMGPQLASKKLKPLAV